MAIIKLYLLYLIDFATLIQICIINFDIRQSFIYQFHINLGNVFFFVGQ